MQRSETAGVIEAADGEERVQGEKKEAGGVENRCRRCKVADTRSLLPNATWTRFGLAHLQDSVKQGHFWSPQNPGKSHISTEAFNKSQLLITAFRSSKDLESPPPQLLSSQSPAYREPRAMRSKVPAIIGKRKRVEETEPLTPSFQIIAGSYDRTLLGLVARGSPKPQETCAFSINFLFNAHASSIRSLAVSSQSHSTDSAWPEKRLLATGGADERINLYQISATTPLQPRSTLNGQPANQELGSLLHHSSTVTALSFPSKGKLISASLDNTIAISRIRDGTVLSTIRAPIPKSQGRPSGDTAAPGDVPAGINDVAVHPSAKLCMSVARGEKSMRLWNLVTGKKEGVLTFPKLALTALGEGRWRGGEARSIVFSQDGGEFAVGFEYGALIYGLDCELRAIVRVHGSKSCRIRYSPQEFAGRHVLAMSTEDGRVLFFDTAIHKAPNISAPDGDEQTFNGRHKKTSAPHCLLLAELGAVKNGSRIKDFVILASLNSRTIIYVVTGTSGGTVTIWSLEDDDVFAHKVPHAWSDHVEKKETAQAVNGANNHQKGVAPKQVGRLMGTFESGKRITCLEAFILEDSTTPAKETGTGEAEDQEDDWEGFDLADDVAALIDVASAD